MCLCSRNQRSVCVGAQGGVDTLDWPEVSYMHLTLHNMSHIFTLVISMNAVYMHVQVTMYACPILYSGTTLWNCAIFPAAYPHIDLLMTNVSSRSGPSTISPASSLGIKCDYSGVPKPISRWYRNGNLIDDNELIVESVINSRGGSSMYESTWGASMPQSGVYQCLVTNQYGVAISSTVLCAQSECTCVTLWCLLLKLFVHVLYWVFVLYFLLYTHQMWGL